MDSLLSKLYYDKNSPAAFSSERKLWRVAKQKNAKITLKKVRGWIASQNVPSRFANKPKKSLPRATFITHSANNTWTADLADFSRLSKFNRGYKWMLIVQDLYSRKLKGLIAQKNKTAKETAQSLDALFSKEQPKKSFLTDQGKEFSGECKQIYRKYNIEWYTTHDVTQKVATVERALLVVKQRLFKIMARDESKMWIDKLEPILHVYNQTVNRTLGMTPIQAEKRENQSEVFRNSVAKVEVKKGYKNFRYDIGQAVRILKEQHFSKGYTGNFSNILYEIYEREQRSGAPVYYLKDLLTGEKVVGSFYDSELRPVDIDKSKLPKIDQIYGIRLEHDQEYVLVKIPGERNRKWVLYDSLIPYAK